jgi:hypothetical protein
MKMIVDQAIPEHDWNLLLISIASLVTIPVLSSISKFKIKGSIIKKVAVTERSFLINMVI